MVREVLFDDWRRVGSVMIKACVVKFCVMNFSISIGRFIKVFLVMFVSALVLTASNLTPGDRIQRVRVFTRNIEFNYVGWAMDALGLKIDQYSLGAGDYLQAGARKPLVLEYLNIVAAIQRGEAQLNDIYGDPDIADPEAASQEIRQQLADLKARREQIAPVAEAVLQSQISAVVGSMGLTLGGQPLPPVLYHSTPLPLALIVSPRDVIRQDADISLIPDLSLDQIVDLENQVDRSLNVSSLVVPVGGIGIYPTMVQQTSDLNWLTEVVSHEWVHNFLTLRPLGVSYYASPELRTMNETTASIAGKEIGRAVLERFYPERVPPEPAEPAVPQAPTSPSQPEFDFRAEMRITRVNVDQLLADGKIEEAERYMEQRRIFFWEHGYHIRKLNQAYFAFYGAYADQPGGAAGEDPVGAAVRDLRVQSPNLSDFLNRISWMWKFQQLQQAVHDTPS
jgi:hypothetical protein